jgi:hypothetical protein
MNFLALKSLKSIYSFFVKFESVIFICFLMNFVFFLQKKNHEKNYLTLFSFINYNYFFKQ